MHTPKCFIFVAYKKKRFTDKSRRSHVHTDTDMLMHVIYEPLVLILVEDPVAFLLHTNRRKCRYLNIKTAVSLVWGFEQCNPWIYDYNNNIQTIGMIYVCLVIHAHASLHSGASQTECYIIVNIYWFNNFYIEIKLLA